MVPSVRCYRDHEAEHGKVRPHPAGGPAPACYGGAGHRLTHKSENPVDTWIVTSPWACRPCGGTPRSGIKSGMKSGFRSYPTWDEIEPALGDKVINAVVAAVASTVDDLADYRRFRPAWVAQASERGLAAWIHDRLWYHLVAALDDHPQVTITDKGVLREIT